MLSKTVKSLRKAGVEGYVVNDESADANSFISFDLDLQSNNISVPVGGQREDSRKRKAIVSAGMAERDNNNCIQLLQRRDLPASAQEDRKKDKAIVSADMVERDENKFVQLLQRGKRMRVNSSSSREVNKFTVCEDSKPCSSSDFATQRKIQDCRNDVVVNSSRDDTSERNINFSCKPQGFSRVHRNERQLARLENTRGGLLSLSKAGDQGISSEAGSPEVIFLGSRTSTQRNHSFTRENSDIFKELSRGVEVDDHTPIDVDSLEYTINETVNLEESNKETSARARQIEQDELLARRIQEVLVREKGERGVQQDALLSDLVVQRELKEHVGSPDFDSASVLTGLCSNNISVPVGGQREDSRKRKAIVSAGMAERDNNNCIQLLQRRDLPASAQEDRKKDKAIVSADMVERDKNKFVQLLQRGKRMRVNSSSSREINKFTVCEDSNPCSSSDFATQRKIQDCRNDVVVNSSRDDISERNINFSCKPQGFSRVHRNERQLARLENTRGGLLSLSKAGDQGISSEAGSPEVIFLGSRTSTQRNHSFTRENSDIIKELSRGVEVDDHTPIDVDSLEYTINETVNLEESNKETSARARQIEQDELLARRIQKVLVREKGERGVQQDALLSDLVVQRELKEHVGSPDFDSASVLTGLCASCATGGRREPSHSLTAHPLLTSFPVCHSTCPLHRRRDGHSTCPLHRRRDGHLTCPLHTSRDVQSTCPLHRRRDGHRTCPQNTSRDGHSTCPLHRRDGGHSTCPLHRRRDGHPTCPIHTSRDCQSTCPLHRRDGGHSTCPVHRRRDDDLTCLLHRRDELSGRWHRASGRPFHCSRFQFPSDRNIDMRVDVLEVTEHAVESNATHRFLAGGQRDFNENDYDKLLVLDDDNSNWKGASQQHIDGLPISTVQNDISDEVCSVCLEKQKAGDVIRHLLCTHKFHKECIDPWLAIQASCPICKSSVKARQLCRRQLA